MKNKKEPITDYGTACLPKKAGPKNHKSRNINLKTGVNTITKREREPLVMGSPPGFQFSQRMGDG